MPRSKIDEDLRQHILNYLRSDGVGGQKIINAFIEEFKVLSFRSPPDDPTNLMKHMGFLEEHIKKTWDESLAITRDGDIAIGVCNDATLGFEEDREKLKHNPVPTVWVVYLIRGIAGEYAFVNPATYQAKMKAQMPGEYFGGFLISKDAWNREGWNRVGSFEQYKHPASGAPPIMFFENVMSRIDMGKIIGEAIESFDSSKEEE